MAGIQQSPISDWQPAPTGSQPPLPGTPLPAVGFGPAPAGMQRRRKLVLITALAAVVIVAGLIAGALGGKPKGSLALPSRLLGLPKATSASARQLAAKLRTQERAGASGKLTGVVAGVYGSPGAWLAISGGGICGTCSAIGRGAEQPGRCRIRRCQFLPGRAEGRRAGLRIAGVAGQHRDPVHLGGRRHRRRHAVFRPGRVGPGRCRRQDESGAHRDRALTGRGRAQPRGTRRARSWAAQRRGGERPSVEAIA